MLMVIGQFLGDLMSQILVDLLTYIAYSIQIIDDRELDKFLTDCIWN